MAKRPIEWHPEDVRAAVRKRLKTIAALARSSGFSLSAICQAINGRNFLPGPCLAISTAIEVSPHELWPDWYAPDGTPRKGRDAIDTANLTYRTDHTRPNGNSRDQTRRAA